VKRVAKPRPAINRAPPGIGARQPPLAGALANWVRDMKNRGHGLELSTGEVAFDDALAEN
jgi:hypothetical protein